VSCQSQHLLSLCLVSWGCAFCFFLFLFPAISCGQAFGALWYLFTVDRMSQCYQIQCAAAGPAVCDPTWVTCPISLSFDQQSISLANAAWAQNATLLSTCFEAGQSPLPGMDLTARYCQTDSSTVTPWVAVLL